MATRNALLEYTAQPINSFFFAETELVCTTEANSYVFWGRQNNFQENIQYISATTLDGIGIFYAMLIVPGYHSCEITMNNTQISYFTGVFNPTTTTG